MLNLEEVLSSKLNRFKYSGGVWASALCPFHKETRPSFGVNMETGFFNCFSCGARGGIKTLLNRLGISENLVNIRTLKVVRKEPVTSVLPEWILEAYKGKLPKKYLNSGFRKDTLLSHEIGFDTYELRIIFPIRDIDNNLVGISGRTIIDQNPRYKFYKFREIKGYKPAPHRYLWGIDKVRACSEANILDLIVVCEGFKAAMWIEQAGYSAVALMGTFISSDQVRLLGYFYKPTYIFLDNDQAGKANEVKVAQQLLGYVPAIYICRYKREVNQPDELTPEEIKWGIDNAITILERRRENEARFIMES
uniref:Toprim domain-containing protein n=1 Tax=Dictyoglomus turgidum TaxID=513050 RepID=A0A7C3WLZ7_9BACT